MKNIVHIISSLDIGGAETALLRLCREQVKRYSSVVVISLQPKAVLHHDFVEIGVDVIYLDMLNGKQLISVLLRLRTLLLQLKPDVVQSWMYYANFIASLSKIGLSLPLIWSIRRTAVPNTSLFNKFFMRCCALLSYVSPNRICFNAQAGLLDHVQFGYAHKKSAHIGNGYDFTHFAAKSDVRQKFRNELCIADDVCLIICIGRWHVDKGQDLLLKAMPEVMKYFSNLKLVMIGRGCDNTNKQLTDLLAELHLVDNVIMCGEKDPVAPWFNIGDVFCLPSRTEGFPNSLVEAMAMGLPCVSTDVGDASAIGAGNIVLANTDSQSLASALCQVLSQPVDQRLVVAEQGKHSVVSRFSIDQVTEKYHNLYLDVLEH